MKRREFITLVSAATAWPLAARAQQPQRIRRIGVIIALPGDNPETKARLAGFRQGLEKLGWSEDSNVHIDYRFAPAGEQAQMIAKELVALQPDVIFAHSTPVVVALQRESRTIPTVFIGIVNPVGQGFVASLTKPGGNITGLSDYEDGFAGKWLQMLKEIAPNLSSAGFLFNPKTAPYHDFFLQPAKAVAPSLAIEIVACPVEDDAADIERAIASFAGVPDGGLVVLPDSTPNAHADLVIRLAAEHRLPAVYSARFFVVAGGLMSYGIDYVEQYRQAAFYVDRILRGDKPADLPVQFPTKFETMLNLKTAKALDLPVPPVLLVAADEVIE